jgi:hypothetical protein
VGKVEAFWISGLELWFWSDDHDAPHFHVKRAGKWEVRVYVRETTPTKCAFSVKWGIGPTGREQRTLAALVATHRMALLDEWERKVLKGGD